ncbi:hypothetical protein F5B21DRAFT_518768 [Xylaria acuta]|nr:hypothetical protein F5B21DRAFT_518768 [Xylaria acuta]
MCEKLLFHIDQSVILHRRELSHSTVLFLDDDIAVKMYNQYRIPDVELPSGDIYLHLSLGGFVAQNMERDIFTRLKNFPSSNLVRQIGVGDPICIFFERLRPLTSVRWALELASAFVGLESLGLIPTKACVQDLGIDRTGRLKIVGFGSSPSQPSAEEIGQYEADPDSVGFHPTEIWRQNMARAHQHFASCLHYILSGINPDERALGCSTLQELTAFREKVRRGEYPVATDARAVADNLQAAWTLKTGTESFTSVAEKVRSAFNGLEVEPEEALPAPPSDEHYRILGGRCREWIKAQEQDLEWMACTEYEAACEKIGIL